MPRMSGRSARARTPDHGEGSSRRALNRRRGIPPCFRRSAPRRGPADEFLGVENAGSPDSNTEQPGHAYVPMRRDTRKASATSSRGDARHFGTPV